MSSNLLTLFCLADGDATSNAFPVYIEPTKTVGDLKKLIKAEKANAFSDIDADQLTLWRVSIPDDDNEDETPIMLNNLPEKMKLRATHRISTVFDAELPESIIRVFVQRPPPVQAPVPARVSTPPIQLRSVQYGDIEKELAVVLSGVQHHASQRLDAKDLEMSQKEQLGRFFKRTLPYHRTAKDISLVMLGLELDKQAKASDGKTTLRSIVEDDVGAFSGNSVVAMVAPSGSGKTATVIDLATRHFVVYCVCSTPHATVSPDFNDPNFITLAMEVEKMYMAVVDKEQGDQVDIDFEVKALAGERIELEFLARLLFLQFLLNNNPDLKPQQFFREQTAIGGASTIGELVKRLRAYDSTAIHDMLDMVQAKLHSLLVPRRLGLVIAVDEAQVAENGILANKLISPSVLIDSKGNRDAIFDGKNQVQFKHRRGFLTPLSATLSNMRATLVILGTALSLQNADHIYSTLDKTNNFIRITDFPQFDESDVNKMISDLIDLSDCEIPPPKRRKLSGRARFSLGIIKRLIATELTQISKQATLDSVVDRTIEHVKRGLRDSVQTILESDKTGEASRLLCRMVLANRLRGGKISFATSQQSDFVNKALCRLRQHSDGVHLVMDEPMVVEAVEEELKASGKDPTFTEYMDQIHQIVTNFGVASSSKGDALEPLVRRSLQRFNGFRLVDLPFLQGIQLPIWCDNLQIQIDDINTANGFGYMASGTAADLAFLIDCPPSKMLIAKSGTRPDGVWFFPDKRYAGSLAIKFYSGSVPQSAHKENDTSSDVRTCFLKADGITTNPSLAGIRRDFEASGIPANLKGILRIHLEFPYVKGLAPVTHVRKDPTTGVEDVMVYINSSNMDTFFDKGIAAHKNDMVMLKRLIKFVSTQP